MNRDMLSRRLTRRGFDVVVAEDGVEAVQAAHSTSPDIILMDLSLPVKDGWQATRELKADIATQDIPIIALSAHAMTEDLGSATQAGCDDYDTKPVELDRLLTKIAALLRPEVTS